MSPPGWRSRSRPAAGALAAARRPPGRCAPVSSPPSCSASPISGMHYTAMAGCDSTASVSTPRAFVRRRLALSRNTLALLATVISFGVSCSCLLSLGRGPESLKAAIPEKCRCGSRCNAIAIRRPVRAPALEFGRGAYAPPAAPARRSALARHPRSRMTAVRISSPWTRSSPFTPTRITPIVLRRRTRIFLSAGRSATLEARLDPRPVRPRAPQPHRRDRRASCRRSGAQGRRAAP